jgi:hypothetical protein
MEVDELRQRLAVILAAEEQEPVDWSEVERLTTELLPQLHVGPTPEIVFHYVDDVHIRARDEEYALRQRRGVRRFVENGDYDDGTPVPLWGCALVVLLAGSLIFWLTR